MEQQGYYGKNMTYELAQTPTIVINNRRQTSSSPEVALQRGKFVGMLICLGCWGAIAFPGVNASLQNSAGILVRGGTPAKTTTTATSAVTTQVSNPGKKQTVDAIAPSNIPNSGLGKKIIAAMQAKGYKVNSKGSIVFVKGFYCKDTPDRWCDLQTVVKADGTILYQGRSTTRPGNAWYPSKSNPSGVLQIKEGQFASWKFGEHCGASGRCHSALVQTNNISATRSFSTARQGETSVSGVYGANIHSGPSTFSDSVGLWSAGCLVASTRKEHEQFMGVVRGIYSDNDTITATVLRF
jgi:hypothetical protein